MNIKNWMEARRESELEIQKILNALSVKFDIQIAIEVTMISTDIISHNKRREIPVVKIVGNL